MCKPPPRQPEFPPPAKHRHADRPDRRRCCVPRWIQLMQPGENPTAARTERPYAIHNFSSSGALLRTVPLSATMPLPITAPHVRFNGFEQSRAFVPRHRHQRRRPDDRLSLRSLLQHRPPRQRTRPSAIVSQGGTTVLIDATPELRLQCVANRIDMIDALVLMRTRTPTTLWAWTTFAASTPCEKARSMSGPSRKRIERSQTVSATPSKSRPPNPNSSART